jgi:hypothetical protein
MANISLTTPLAARDAALPSLRLAEIGQALKRAAVAGVASSFAASLPDGVVAPVLDAARASAHVDPGRSVPDRQWEMGGQHRSDRDEPAVA